MYKAELLTKNITPGKNTREFIILHHTGTGPGTIKGVLNTLTKGNVSAHYVIDSNGDKYKIGSTDNILWHAGVSEWKGRKNMNNYSIGIEVVGPTFTDEQRKSTKDLIQHLMYTFKIPRQNVIRHKDVAPKRKVDIDDSFWRNKYLTFKDYQDSLLPVKFN